MNERELGMIIARLDNIKEDIDEIKTTFEKQNDRIKSLEKFRAWSTGAGTLCASVLGGVVTFLKAGG